MIKLKLHQFIAAIKDRNAAADRDFTNAYHTLQKQQLFGGLRKSYRPRLDDGVQLPGEKQLVQATVPGALVDIRVAVAKLIDTAATRDEANQRARASVFINGARVTDDLPLSTLLWLEKKLTDLRTVITAIPVLPTDDTWTFDDNNSWWISEPSQTLRQVKVANHITVAPATEKHQATVVREESTVVEGTWTTEKFSGAVPAWQKTKMRDRLDTLIVAVKTAREQANQVDVEDAHVGGAIMDYIFG